jgi:hypothetical protein
LTEGRCDLMRQTMTAKISSRVETAANRDAGAES